MTTISNFNPKSIPFPWWAAYLQLVGYVQVHDPDQPNIELYDCTLVYDPSPFSRWLLKVGRKANGFTGGIDIHSVETPSFTYSDFPATTLKMAIHKCVEQKQLKYMSPDEFKAQIACGLITLPDNLLEPMQLSWYLVTTGCEEAVYTTLVELGGYRSENWIKSKRASYKRKRK
jgi:hypothetical protein